MTRKWTIRESTLVKTQDKANHLINQLSMTGRWYDLRIKVVGRLFEVSGLRTEMK